MADANVITAENAKSKWQCTMDITNSGFDESVRSCEDRSWFKPENARLQQVGERSKHEMHKHKQTSVLAMKTS